MTASSAAPLSPPVVWAQRSSTLTITIQLMDASNSTPTITCSSVSYSGTCGVKEYATSLSLYAPINTEKSSVSITPRDIHFTLVKETEAWWPSLCEGPKPVNVKVDFSRWVDEDEEEEVEQADAAPGMPGMGGMDIQSMMAGMGGGGDMEAMMKSMGGMGAGGMSKPTPDSDDDDDEDLPPLEDTPKV